MFQEEAVEIQEDTDSGTVCQVHKFMPEGRVRSVTYCLWKLPYGEPGGEMAGGAWRETGLGACSWLKSRRRQMTKAAFVHKACNNI